MGAANVIPGVSGGTIAFITGIYERLLNSLKSFDIPALTLLLKGKFQSFAAKTDLTFLLLIFLGVAISIVSLAKAIELAFIHYEELTLSFFFGLIIASIWAVSRQVSSWNFGTIGGLLLGLCIAVSISFLPPAQANENALYVFLCGIVAVCSMILPGLSGSFILLLMGNYLLVMQSISSFNFSILIPLMVGVIVGLVLFSRLLSYLFSHYRDLTIALLAGFVAGSLLIIWPWKETIYEILEGKQKAVGYVWKLPEIDLNLPISVLFILAGFMLVWIIEWKSSKNI